MKAYRHLVKFSIASGAAVSVWDGEEWQVKRSTSFKAICEAIESVEEAQLRIRDQSGNPVGWALVSAFGLAPEETVMDYSVNEFMEAWSTAYDTATA